MAAEVARSDEAESTAKPAAAQSAPVDFKSEVQPILARRCLKCHGTDGRGGLRLDDPKFAAAGGDSSKPVLGGTLETNELYQRVAATDSTYRMPKNSDPLPPAELETIKRWVEHGTPWPTADLAAATSTFGSWGKNIDNFVERNQREILFLRWYAWLFLASQIVLLTISRAKLASRRGRAWTTGRMAPLCRFANSVTGASW